MEQYKDEKGRLRYCYSLTKMECFFVAAGFNEEVTIKMALRWNQLEYEFSEFVLPQLRGLDDEDVLERADDIIAEELEELNQQCKYCYTSTEIAKPYGLNANDLLSFLSDKGIVMYWTQSDFWKVRPDTHDYKIVAIEATYYQNRSDVDYSDYNAVKAAFQLAD